MRRDFGFLLALVVIAAFFGRLEPGRVASPPAPEPVWSVDHVALEMPLSQVAPLFQPTWPGAVSTDVREFWSGQGLKT